MKKTLALATLSYAATDTAPNAPAAVTQAASKIGMADALTAAKAKFPDAEALSARFAVPVPTVSSGTSAWKGRTAPRPASS